MADNFLHYFSHRNSQFNQVQLCENSSSQGGPQSPLGGGVMQNASWRLVYTPPCPAAAGDQGDLAVCQEVICHGGDVVV